MLMSWVIMTPIWWKNYWKIILQEMIPLFCRDISSVWEAGPSVDREEPGNTKPGKEASGTRDNVP